MRAAPDLTTATNPKGRDETILNAIMRSAIRKNDFDAANYAIGRIVDPVVRARAMLVYGQEYDRRNNGNRLERAAILTNALDLMEMTTPDPSSLCLMGNARFHLTINTSTMTVDELTNRASRIINRIPTPGIDAKAGTSERSEFVSKTLVSYMGCISYLFTPVISSISTVYPNPDLADQIKVKEWRLAAKIEVEKSRRYPPVETQTPNSKF